MDIKGWFPNPRLKLATKIMNLGENILPFETPYVDELILFFLSAKYPKLNRNNLKSALSNYDGIVIKNIRFDGHDTLGSVRIHHKDGIKAKVICGFQDLKDWAAPKQYIKWVGWVVTFLSGVLKLITFLLTKNEKMARRR